MLRFADSCGDHYTYPAQKYSAAGGSGPTVVGGGRHGNYLRFLDDAARHVVKSFPDSQATWIVGFAVRPTQVGPNPFFFLQDTGTVHVDLRFNGLMQLTATRNGTLLATTTTIFSPFAWTYAELKVTVHDSAGVVALAVNGVEEVELTGQDTRNGANPSANQIRFAGLGGAGFGEFGIDDLYVCDGNDSGVAGVPNNDFLGDVVVEVELPDGNGNSSQFDGSDGNQTDNYLLVDESGPDDDTTYVASADVGDKDTYAFSGVTPGSGTVYGVQILPRARKTTAGLRKIVSVARVSGVEVDGPEIALGTGYQYHPDVREAKPGGGAWGISDVNGAEFGPKVAA